MRTVILQNKIDIVVDIEDGLGKKYEVENFNVIVHHDEKYGDSIVIELEDGIHSIMDKYFRANNFDLSMALILRHQKELADFFNGVVSLTKKEK